MTSNEPNGVTRRSFMANAAGLLALGSASAFVAACSAGTGDTVDSQSGSAAEDTGAGVAASGSAGQGGLVTGIMTQQIPASLDPFTNSAGAALTASGPCHDWLEYVDPKGTIFPSLAKKVTQADASTVRYELHPDLKFQNDEPIDAEAVVALIAWVQDEANNAWVRPNLEGVEVTVVDELTVEFKLPKPNVAFRLVITRLPIVPVSTMSKQALTPIGAGPYKFVKWVQGSSVEFTKDPNYRHADKIPLEGIRMQHFADANAGTQAFIAGEANFVYPSSLAQAPDLQQRATKGEFEYIAAEPGWTYLAINTETGPFADPRVRKAVRLALDRTQMVNGAFSGVGRPFFSMMNPDSDFYTADLEYDRDIEAAKALLAEAGASGLESKIYTPNVDYFQGIATIAQSNLAEIGINLTVEVEETPAIIDRGLSRKDFDLLVLADAVAPDPFDTIDRYLRTTGLANLDRYSNSKVDELLDQGLAELDEDARQQIYRDIQVTALIEDTAIIPLTAEALPAAYRKCNYPDFIGLYIQYVNWMKADLA